MIATLSHEACRAAGSGVRSGFAAGSGFGVTAAPQAARIAVSASNAANRVHKRFGVITFFYLRFRTKSNSSPSVSHSMIHSPTCAKRS